MASGTPGNDLDLGQYLSHEAKVQMATSISVLLLTWHAWEMRMSLAGVLQRSLPERMQELMPGQRGAAANQSTQDEAESPKAQDTNALTIGSFELTRCQILAPVVFLLTVFINLGLGEDLVRIWMLQIFYAYCLSLDIANFPEASIHFFSLLAILVQVFGATNQHWLLNGGNRTAVRCFVLFSMKEKTENTLYNLAVFAAFSVKSVLVGKASGVSTFDSFMSEVICSALLQLLSQALHTALNNFAQQHVVEADTAHAETEAAQRMLFAFCDAQVQLDSELQISGSHNRLEDFLAFSSDAAGRCAYLRGRPFAQLLAECDRDRFRSFTALAQKQQQLEATKGGPTSSASPPGCLPVTTINASGAFIPVVLFHVYSKVHLLGIRDDSQHYIQAVSGGESSCNDAKVQAAVEKQALSKTTPEPSLNEQIHVIVIDRSSRGRLGMKLATREDSRLLVTEIIQDGLAEAWNKANPSQQVQAGNCLVDVDGITGVREMIRELQSERVLHVKVATLPRAEAPQSATSASDGRKAMPDLKPSDRQEKQERQEQQQEQKEKDAEQLEIEREASMRLPSDLCSVRSDSFCSSGLSSSQFFGECQQTLEEVSVIVDALSPDLDISEITFKFSTSSESKWKKPGMRNWIRQRSWSSFRSWAEHMITSHLQAIPMYVPRDMEPVSARFQGIPEVLAEEGELMEMDESDDGQVMARFRFSGFKDAARSDHTASRGSRSSMSSKSFRSGSGRSSSMRSSSLPGVPER